MRLVTLFLIAAFAASTVDAASYQKTDGTIVDPTMIHHGEPHSYSGSNLEPDAYLEGADLTKAHLSQETLIKENLTGANQDLSLIHNSEPTSQDAISYADYC